MHYRITGYIRTKIIVLVAVLLFISAACTGIPENGNPTTPGMDQTEDAADKLGKNSSIDKESESRESNSRPEQNSDSGNGEDTGENESNGTSGEKGKTAAELLKDYYYAIIDQPSIDFELEDLEGNTVKLSDLKGKIVFLNFWATWCPPCREEMPHMQAFYDKHKDEGIMILAVNPNQLENQGINDSAKAERKAREFVEKQGFTFPVLLDRDDSVWAVYQQRGIPANYIIDTKGIVRYLKPGAFTGVEEMEAFAEAVKAGDN